MCCHSKIPIKILSAFFCFCRNQFVQNWGKWSKLLQMRFEDCISDWWILMSITRLHSIIMFNKQMVETIQICMGSAEMLNTFCFLSVRKRRILNIWRATTNTKSKRNFKLSLQTTQIKMVPNAGEKRNNYEIQTRTRGKK